MPSVAFWIYTRRVTATASTYCDFILAKNLFFRLTYSRSMVHFVHWLVAHED